MPVTKQMLGHLVTLQLNIMVPWHFVPDKASVLSILKFLILEWRSLLSDPT